MTVCNCETRELWDLTLQDVPVQRIESPYVKYRFIGQLSEELNLRMLNNRFIGQLSEILTNFVFESIYQTGYLQKSRNI